MHQVSRRERCIDQPQGPGTYSLGHKVPTSLILGRCLRTWLARQLEGWRGGVGPLTERQADLRASRPMTGLKSQESRREQFAFSACRRRIGFVGQSYVSVIWCTCIPHPFNNAATALAWIREVFPPQNKASGKPRSREGVDCGGLIYKKPFAPDQWAGMRSNHRGIQFLRGIIRICATF